MHFKTPQGSPSEPFGAIIPPDGAGEGRFESPIHAHLRGIYYLMMARALDAVSDRPLIGPDGKDRDWPVDLAERLLATVRDSKLWMNDNPAWYEGDSTLVTTYVLNICGILFHYVRSGRTRPT